MKKIMDALLCLFLLASDGFAGELSGLTAIVTGGSRGIGC